MAPSELVSVEPVILHYHESDPPLSFLPARRFAAGEEEGKTA